MKKIFFALSLLTSMQVFAQDNQLLVGLSGLDMKPKIGIPLAGYGDARRRQKDFIDWRFKDPEAFFFKPSEGVHSPIRAKVMALKKGEEHLIFVSLDTIGLEDRFVKRICKNLATYNIKESDVIFSATHTHGGPGTLSKRVPLMAIAVDLYKDENYEYIVSKVTESIEDALDSLRPAELFKSKAVINGVQKNKWRRKTEQHYDKRASFLIAKDKETGDWLGGLVNFSIHGGTMPMEVMLYSSDVNGAIEKELENHMSEKNPLALNQPVFLFMNGAEGDVGADIERSIENVTTIGKRFIQEAESALTDISLEKVAPEFSSKKKKIYVGVPKLPLRDCQEGLMAKAPKWLNPVLYPMLPLHSYVSLAKVGDITYLSWPGEASTQLGYDLQAIAKEMGAKDPIVLGLAQDYMAYFTTQSEFAEKKYDSCSTLYGWKAGERIIEAHKGWL
jgi:neutral ceramidase